MKKLFSLAVAVLISAQLVSSQDFSIVGRFDWPLDYNIYTFLDGEIGEHVSYSFSNHWVSSETKLLYQNTWRSSNINWCDWANFTFTFGNFYITAGKDIMLTGSNEESPNDVDNYYFLCSDMWNLTQVYQWGGKLGYTFEAAHTTFEAQFCSSPLDERPFSGHGVLSFGVSGEYGFYNPHLTANFISFDPGIIESEDVVTNGRYCNLTLGNLFCINDNLEMFLDYIATPNSPLGTSHHIIFGTDWRIIDHLALKVKGGYERYTGKVEDIFGYQAKNWFAGALLEYYPLKNDDLRIHAGGGYNGSFDDRFNVGITYNFNVTRLFKK